MVSICYVLCVYVMELTGIVYGYGMNLTEGEDRWEEYTEELYKKDLHDPDNHNGVSLT